jgi:dihydrodipicolinate synthase/N-acetylneuraminate lyase
VKQPTAQESLHRKSQQFEGVIVPLFLPLDEDERIIEGELTKYVRHLLDRGVNGFLVPSGTGEFYNLAAEQRRRATEIVAEEVQGRALVISLTSDCSTRRALRLIQDAREAGADAAMMTPPYFSAVSQAVLKVFFTTLADEGGLPLWFYHQPTHTKIVIEPETVAELAENPNIVGIKASAWVDMLYYHRLVRIMRHKPEFRILMGEDINDLSGLILGGHGMIATLANILPDEFVGLWSAVKREDWTTARKLQDRIMDVQEALLFAFEDWQGAGKLVLQHRGFYSSTRCASPCATLSSDERKKIEMLGKKLQLF